MDYEGLRDAGLSVVGGVLHTAANTESLGSLPFNVGLQLLTPFIQMAEVASQHPSLPEGIGLPRGFTEHYVKDVLPDLNYIRGNSEASMEFRQAVEEILNDPNLRSNLYRPGGPTYSELLRDIRKGHYYRGLR